MMKIMGLSIVCLLALILGLVESPTFAQECIVDEDCYDDSWCTGNESCINNQCVDGALPCYDENPCTIDICEEVDPPGELNTGTCSHQCAAVGTTDPCCSDPVCAQYPICTAQVTIKPEDGQAYPGDVGIKVDLCLDNQNYAVGGVQLDLCEEFDGSPINCLLCTGCELTERTTLFDCFINELDDGCCRVILMSKNPGGVINREICSIVEIVYRVDENCAYHGCSSLLPTNLTISDQYAHELIAVGLKSEFCFLSDTDGDGIPDREDNCPTVYNPNQEDGDGDGIGVVCDNCPILYNPDQTDYDEDERGDACDNCTDTDDDGYGNTGFPNNTCPLDNCPYTANPGQEDNDEDGLGNLCDNCPDHYNPGQEDTRPPGGNNCGDACECESDLDRSGSVDGLDTNILIADYYPRNPFNRPCTSEDPCMVDLNCDKSVNGLDILIYLEDLPRNPFSNPCPPCSGILCLYE